MQISAYSASTILFTLFSVKLANPTFFITIDVRTQIYIIQQL